LNSIFKSNNFIFFFSLKFFFDVFYSRKGEQASNTYLKCADCERIAKSGEEVEYIVQAADSIRKVNNATAIDLMQKACDLYISDSRISYAAKLKKTIGEIYENDGELILAAKFYQEAADLFYAEGDNTRYNLLSYFLCISFFIYFPFSLQ
jgi:Soluble NSF attachment protein, SNAP